MLLPISKLQELVVYSQLTSQTTTQLAGALYLPPDGDHQSKEVKGEAERCQRFYSMACRKAESLDRTSQKRFTMRCQQRLRSKLFAWTHGRTTSASHNIEAYSDSYETTELDSRPSGSIRVSVENRSHNTSDSAEVGRWTNLKAGNAMSQLLDTWKIPLCLHLLVPGEISC